MASIKLRGSGLEKTWSSQEQQAMIKEVRKQIGPVADKFPTLYSDDSILRFLRARNWNAKKASKMLKETLKWRLDFKPEKIRWEDVAGEAETGKIYRANYYDKFGRSVLIMRPGFQNTTAMEGQIKYLVYCLENAILDSRPGQEQMVWLIDFQNWNMSSISVKVTRETAHVLQDRYPERLGLAILYNPPKVFESFWLMVKPFLDRKTYKKVKFAYSNNPQSQKIMEALFDMEKLESAFGGINKVGFDYKSYAERMREADKKMSEFFNSGCPTPSAVPELLKSESFASDAASEASEGGEVSSTDEMMSNVEGVDEKIEDQLLSAEDIINAEKEAANDQKIEKKA